MPSQNKDPQYYSRNLPHRQPTEGVFFVTYNLEGALPKDILKNLREERDLKIAEWKDRGLTEKEIKKALRKIHDLYFGKFDDLLDNPNEGPLFLKDPSVAQLVVDSIRFLDGNQYKLICFTIMSNHVHKIVYKTQKVLFRIMQSHKGFTGFEANKILGRREPFWQPESFDHQIRNREWLWEKVRYVLNNPVKAGLVKHWRDWENSYINTEFLKYAPK